MSKLDQYRNGFMQALSQSNWQEVIRNSTELLKLDEFDAMLWTNRGVALQKLGFALDAVLNYDKAIAHSDNDEQRAVALTNKGAAYWDMLNSEAAIQCLNAAIDLVPFAQAHMTLANVEKHQGQLQKAIASYRSSVYLNPDYADAHMALGMALLKAGNLQEGWKEYEWRWKSEQLPARKLKCPQWTGQDLTNKTILVYGEQGLGDIIQFARYASLLANQFPRAKIIVEGRPALKRLLECLPDVYSVINCGDKLPDLHYAVPMLTLAGIMTRNINEIISNEFEYFLDVNDVESWEERLKPLTNMKPEALKVGICWAGMSRDANPGAAAVDAIRSTTLESFAPLTGIPGIVWVSLQKGPPASQLKNMPANMLLGDFTEDMFDFYDTCCAIRNLDLVITVDTAVVHAAASIGKPTWLLSRWDGCWRWFGDRQDSPWYPSLRQFTQPSPGDWEGMMEKVAKELEILAKSNLTLAKQNNLGYLPASSETL